MKTLFASALFASAVMVGSLANIGEARAAAGFEGPQFGLQQNGSSHIEQVRDGCGPGGFRDRGGYCRRGGYRAPPPRMRCPPYTHPTPYGCRRN